MKVIILAGGFATKLYPITENEPKGLLEIGSRSIVGNLISNFSSTRRVDEYIVVSNHKFCAQFAQRANTRKEKITVLDDGATEKANIYGAVKDIQLAIKECNIDEDCIVVASDLLFDFSFVSFIDYSIRKGTTCCMRYYEENELKLHRVTVADVGFDDKVKKLVYKPRDVFSNWCIPNLYYFKKEDLMLVDEALENGVDPDSFGQFAEYVSKKSPIYCVEMPGLHMRITNEASLIKARKSFNPFS